MLKYAQHKASVRSFYLRARLAIAAACVVSGLCPANAVAEEPNNVSGSATASASAAAPLIAGVRASSAPETNTVAAVLPTSPPPPPRSKYADVMPKGQTVGYLPVEYTSTGDYSARRAIASPVL